MDNNNTPNNPIKEADKAGLHIIKETAKVIIKKIKSKFKSKKNAD